MAAEAEEEKLLKIIDLNDDCLIEISRYLNSKDLMALSEANSRFHSVIQSVVPHVCIDVNQNVNLEGAGKFFKKFGDEMKILRISNATALEQLVEYLNGGQIENRELCYVTTVLNEEFIEENLTFFTSLKVFKLNYIKFTRHCYEKIFNSITEVRELHLDKVVFCDEIELNDILTKMHSFRRLKAFGLLFCRVNTGVDCGLLPINTTIEELTLKQQGLNFTILNHFPNVRSLNARYLNETFDYKSFNMNNLRELSLCYGGDNEEPLVRSLLSTLAQSNGLDCLELVAFTCAEFPEQILQSVGKMTNLKELSLVSLGSIDVDIIAFAKNLKRLKKFALLSGTPVEVAKACEFLQLIPELEMFRVPLLCTDFGSLFGDITQIRRSQNKKLIFELMNADSVNGRTAITQTNSFVKMKKFDNLLELFESCF